LLAFIMCPSISDSHLQIKKIVCGWNDSAWAL